MPEAQHQRHIPARSASSLKLMRLLTDRRGSTAVIAALVFPIVVGGVGLGVETGFWYYKHRELQHAADVAAHAAAVRRRSGDGIPRMHSAALEVATRSGYTGTAEDFGVNWPPARGPSIGDVNAVEVTARMIQPRLFSSVFSDEPIAFSARAVALIRETSKACVLALARQEAGALTVAGSTEVNLVGCSVASNSNTVNAFEMHGAGKLSTECVYAVGGAITTSGLMLTECDGAKEYAAPVADPYASVVEPVVQGTCQNKNVGRPNGETVLTPNEIHPSGVKAMRFCDGLSIKGDISFKPGLYIVEGGTFTINDGTSAAGLSGEGVTFFLTNGAEFKLNGGASLLLKAPTEGPFAGLLFFGGRDQSSVEHRLLGTSDTVLQGAVYTPASNLIFRGNSSSTDGCTQLIANTVEMSGNSGLESRCEAVGGNDIIASATVKLIE